MGAGTGSTAAEGVQADPKATVIARAAQEELLTKLTQWWTNELVTTAKGHAAIGELLRKGREFIDECRVDDTSTG